MSLPIVSAVVLNYKNFTEAIECVKTLFDQRYPSLNCVVVDNCSPNDSFIELRRAFAADSRVTTLSSDRNAGYAVGNNVGAKWAIEHCHPKYLLILNPDVRLNDPTTLDQLVGFAEAHDDAAAVGPKVVLPNGFIQGPYKRPSLLRLCIQYLVPPLWYISRKCHQRWAGKLHRPRKCFRTIGACMLLRADDFAACDMFDEATFLEAEEQILAERFRSVGKHFYYFPATTVVHHHSRAKQADRAIGSTKYYFQRYRGASNEALTFLEFCARAYQRIYAPLEHRILRT